MIRLRHLIVVVSLASVGLTADAIVDSPPASAEPATSQLSQSSLNDSQQAAVRELAVRIQSDVTEIAAEVMRARAVFDQDMMSVRTLLKATAASHKLGEVIIFKRDGGVLFENEQGASLKFANMLPPADLLAKIDANTPEIAAFPASTYMAAVIRLRAFDETFLYVGRAVDPSIFGSSAIAAPAEPAAVTKSRARPDGVID